MAYPRAGIPLFTALLCLFLLQGDGKASESSVFTILYPFDRSVVTGAGLSHLLVELNHPAEISVRLNGNSLNNPTIREKVHHYPLRLEFGLNSIEVEARGNDKLLAKERREMFFFSYIVENNKIPPGFGPKPFHRSDNKEEKCLACHVLKPKKSDLAPTSPRASSCYVCHRELTRFKQVHGPASLWNCLMCHDANSSPVKYGTAVPVRDLCYRCHKTQKEYFFSRKYQHGPTATGMCTICHNPHASDNEYWLKKSPWDLCTSCHTEKASGRHVIAWGPTGDTHPTRGRPDPMKPERELSCRSCHNPHASDAPKLWNFNATTRYQLCWTCHRK